MYSECVAWEHKGRGGGGGHLLNVVLFSLLFSVAAEFTSGSGSSAQQNMECFILLGNTNLPVDELLHH